MKVFGKIFTAIIFILLYAPIFVLVALSFNTSKSTVMIDGFTFQWYKELFTNSNLMGLLLNTLILAVTSSVVATLLGTTAALGISKMKKRTRNLVMSVTNIPMSNPEIVTGVSLALLFVFIGRFIGTRNSLSFATILIAHITFTLPYVILNVLPKLAQTDRHLSEAALDLGATEMQAFFKVVLPAISPGILSGFLMAFTLSIDDFVISYYTTGADFVTLPLKIYAMTKKTVKPDMYALSTIIFVTVLMLLVCINLMQFKAEKKSHRAPHK